MPKPTINTINTYLQKPSTYQQPSVNIPTSHQHDNAVLGSPSSYSKTASPSSYSKTASKDGREPGEDEAGIGEPLKAWSLAEWIAVAHGDFHVRCTLMGDIPISRGF